MFVNDVSIWLFLVGYLVVSACSRFVHMAGYAQNRFASVGVRRRRECIIKFPALLMSWDEHEMVVFAFSRDYARRHREASF